MKRRIPLEDVNVARPTDMHELWNRVVQVWYDLPADQLIKAGRDHYRARRIDRMLAKNGERFENEHWIGFLISWKLTLVYCYYYFYHCYLKIEWCNHTYMLLSSIFSDVLLLFLEIKSYCLFRDISRSFKSLLWLVSFFWWGWGDFWNFFVQRAKFWNLFPRSFQTIIIRGQK